MLRRNFLKLIGCLPSIRLAKGDTEPKVLDDSTEIALFVVRLLKEIVYMTERGFPPDSIWLNAFGFDQLEKNKMLYQSEETMFFLGLPIIELPGEEDWLVGRLMCGYFISARVCYDRANDMCARI